MSLNIKSFIFSCLSISYADHYQFIDDYKIKLKTIPLELSANAVSQMQQSFEDSMDVTNNELIDMI